MWLCGCDGMLVTGCVCHVMFVIVIYGNMRCCLCDYQIYSVCECDEMFVIVMCSGSCLTSVDFCCHLLA